jgi:hypothetical protein
MTLSETARAIDPHDGTSEVPPAAFVSTAAFATNTHPWVSIDFSPIILYRTPYSAVHLTP